MYRTILSATLLAMSLNVLAQSKAIVNTSKPFDVDPKYTSTSSTKMNFSDLYRFEDSKQIVVFKIINESGYINTREFLVWKLNSKTLELEQSTTVLIPEGAIFRAISSVNFIPYVFYSETDKKTKTTHLFAQEFNVGTFELSNQPIPIVDITGSLVELKMGGLDFQNGMLVKQISNDQLMLQYIVEGSKTLPDKLHVHVMDKQLEEVEKKEAEFPTKLNPWTSSVVSDNTLNFYFSGEQKGSSASKVLLRYSYEDNKFFEPKFNFSGNEFTIAPVTMNTGEVVFGGNYYSADGKTVEGVVLFRYDKEGQVFNGIKMPLDKKLNSMYNTNDAAGQYIPDAMPTEVHQTADGGLLVVAERNHSESNSQMTYHYSGSMFVFRISPTNALLWAAKVPKKQKSAASSEYNGHFLISGENGHCLIYLDHERNINLKIDSKPEVCTSSNGGYFAVCTINDEDGSFSVKHHFATHDSKGEEPALFWANKGLVLSELNRAIFEFTTHVKGRQCFVEVRLD